MRSPGVGGRLLALALLAGVFAVGVLAGVAGERWMDRGHGDIRPVETEGAFSARRGPGPRRAPPPVQVAPLRDLNGRWLEQTLELTPDQARAVREILQHRRRRTQRIMEATRPEVEAQMDSTRREIQEVLTDQQREQWDAMMGSRRERRPPLPNRR